MELEKLEKQIDELNDKTQSLLETSFRAEDPNLAVEHLMETDRKLYRFLANRAIGYASTRRLIVDDVIKTFRSTSIVLRDMGHKMELVEEKADRIYRIEEELKSKKVTSILLIVFVTIFLLWIMAVVDFKSASEVFKFIAGLFHGAVRLVTGG